MTPKTKVTNASLTITVSFMFWVLNVLMPFLHTLELRQKYASLAISIFASAGIYGSVGAIFKWVLLRVTWLKRLFFAEYFFEGTWIGYYKEKGESYYFVETYEQSFDDIIIRGFSYDMNRKRFAQWFSEAVTYNSEKGILHYSYSCHFVDDVKVGQGVATFSITRESSNQPASHLNGYSSDINSLARSCSWERKISDSGLPPDSVLEQAVTFKTEIDKITN